MEQTKIIKYKLWYKITLVVGVLGLIDVLTQSLVEQNFDLQIGGLTFVVIMFFQFLFGTKVASVFLSYIIYLSYSWFLWLGASAVLRRKIIKLEKDEGIAEEAKSQKPLSKGFKRTLLILLVPFGILLLLGIIINLVSN